MTSEYLNGRMDMMEEFSEDLKELNQSFFTQFMVADEEGPDEKYLLAIHVTLNIIERNLTELSDQSTRNELINMVEDLRGAYDD